MFLKFVNRIEELKFLENRYKNNIFEFFVIYGRRRIGKTELIKQFLKDKSHLYFVCDKSGTVNNLIKFKKRVAEHLNEPVIESNELEDILKYLKDKIKNNKLVLVFDEFSYLVEKDDSIPSLFQIAIDEILKDTNIFLILCGSSISMMEKGILSQKSPLYGRKTAHIKLGSIPFSFFKDFFPLNNIEKNIEFYSILGGVPFYLEKFSDKKNTFENILEQILDKRGELYEEIDFLLKEELREPDVYKIILNAIASGKTKIVEIANSSNMKIQDMDKYLKVLIRLGIVKKEISITETKSKKSIYTIDNNLFNFYFLFFEPYKFDLEIGELKNVKAKLKTTFPLYVGKKFEKLISEEVLKKLKIIDFNRVGRQWGKIPNKPKEENQYEIDLVALNEEKKEIMFCECKWKDNINPKKILEELKEKAKYVDWNNENRKEHYAIFAKSFKEKIKEKNVYLFDLKGLEKGFKCHNSSVS